MNICNKLTVIRIALVPFFVLFMLCSGIPYSALWSLIIFTVASYTDHLDGKLARERNMVTNFGKFLDPMADKILVLSAMVCMVTANMCSPVVLIIVLAREFLVSSLRLVAASQNVVIAADKSGKIKTATQMVSIVVILILLSINQVFGAEIPVAPISHCLMWFTAALTVYSGTEYIVRNRSLIEIK